MTTLSRDPKVGRRRILLPVYGLAVLLALLPAGSVFAQVVDIPAVMNPDLKAPPTAVMVQYGHQFKADIDNANDEMSRDNALFSLMHRVKLSEKTTAFAMGTYTLHSYNFSGGRNGGPTPPPAVNFYQWDDVHRMVIGGIISHDLNDKWRLIGGGVFRSWGEGGADYADSITGGLLGGFDYHPNEDFSIGLIIGAFSALEDSAGILPVPTLKWQFAEGWRLNIGMVSVADPGIGAEVSWQVNDELMLGAGAAFQNRQFRLKDKGRVAPGANGDVSRPSESDAGGVGSESEVPIFALVGWKPTPKTAIYLQGGVAVNGNVRVEDNDGDRIRDDDYDAAPFISLKGQIFF